MLDRDLPTGSPVTIPQYLARTVREMPEREAFRQFDYAENRWISVTWREFCQSVMR